MSTPRRGPASTGNYESQEQIDPDAVAERRSREHIKAADAGVPEGTVVVTSRTPEAAPYNIVLDMDNVFGGGKTPSGFIIWYIPEALLPRLRMHMLVKSGRVILPEPVVEGD